MPVPSITNSPKCENHMTPSHLSNKTAYHNEEGPSLPSYADAMVMSTSLHIWIIKNVFFYNLGYNHFSLQLQALNSANIRKFTKWDDYITQN